MGGGLRICRRAGGLKRREGVVNESDGVKR
jgi:hypothetical protein